MMTDREPTEGDTNGRPQGETTTSDPMSDSRTHPWGQGVCEAYKSLTRTHVLDSHSRAQGMGVRESDKCLIRADIRGAKRQGNDKWRPQRETTQGYGTGRVHNDTAQGARRRRPQGKATREVHDVRSDVRLAHISVG